MSDLTIIQNQPSWQLHTSTVSLALTEQGGHLAPVRFRLGRKWVEPFHIAPWAEEPEVRDLIPLLAALRGDFFCAPFGDGPAWNGEEHPAHGEAANEPWKLEEADQKSLTCSQEAKIRQGLLTKRISTQAGEANVYQTHTFSGYKGPMSFGHHAMLDFRRNGPGVLSTSRFQYGQVYPVQFEDPVRGGYQSLRIGALFDRLDRVPMADGSMANLTKYPAREGFEDLVMIHHYDSEDFAWTAVAFPHAGFVWFALKNPAILASTVLWHSNGGRHYAPWNGRHRGVLGVEDVTSYFHAGLAASVRPNPWSKAGIPTCVKLDPKQALTIPYIMGVAPISADFDKVASLRRIPGGIALISKNKKRVETQVDTAFLQNIYESK